MFDDETLEPISPTLRDGEKLHVPIFQDETISRSNELRRRVWARDGKVPLRKKSQGQSQHISSFIVELTDLLQLSSEQREEQKKLPEKDRVIEDAAEIIYPGKNADGWWNAKRLIAQVSINVLFTLLNENFDLICARLNVLFRYLKSFTPAPWLSSFLINLLPTVPLLTMHSMRTK